MHPVFGQVVLILIDGFFMQMRWGGADGGYVISPPFFMQMRPPMGVMLMSSRLLVSDWSVLFVLVSDWSVLFVLVADWSVVSAL